MPEAWLVSTSSCQKHWISFFRWLRTRIPDGDIAASSSLPSLGLDVLVSEDFEYSQH